MGKKRWLILMAIALFFASLTSIYIALNLSNDMQFNKKIEQYIHDKDEYSERSVILDVTSASQAYQVASDLGIGKDDVRVTNDGKFAAIYFDHEQNIVDLIKQHKEYASIISADYYVNLADISVSPQDYAFSDDLYKSQESLNEINIGNSWNKTKGSGVTVAVIDTGIDTDNPEFAGRISTKSYNASTDKVGITYVEDEQGHGTSVASILAAGVNNSGIVGIAPEANLLVIKCACNTKGEFANTSDLVFGLAYAIEQHADVINMSFDLIGKENPFEKYTSLAADDDIICVAAAGNDSTSDLRWPAADPNVVGVGALDIQTGQLAAYSNYGENVDVIAPGTNLVAQPNRQYSYRTGTSLSCPIIAGAIALYKAEHKYCELQEVQDMLCASSADLGPKGKDWLNGYGKLDMNALLCEQVGTISFNMLTDEVAPVTHKFIVNHTLQFMPEPERNYVVFDDWYYDSDCTELVNWYTDKFASDTTLYAKWINEDDGIPYTYVTLSNGSAEIRSYTGKRKIISIPSEIDGKVVTSIGADAFADNTRLRTITLPDTLTNIADRAFSNCVNLGEIKIPASVRTLGSDAFNGCVRLYVADIPMSGALTSIGDAAFSQCGLLDRMNIPAHLTSLASNAFYKDTSMKQINVSPYNTTFKLVSNALYRKSGSVLVYYPSWLSGTFTIPAGTLRIGDYAFACSRVSGVTIPATVTEIGQNAFESSLIVSASLPIAVNRIGEFVYSNCTSLKSITFAAGTTLSIIPRGMFCGDSALDHVVLPGNITAVGDNAFSGCSSLVSLTLDNHLKTIGEGAFLGTSLRTVTIPASVTDIGKYGFAYNMNLNSVTLSAGSSLKNIGDYTFANCSSLSQFSFPEGLQSIGLFAFSGTGLKTAALPSTLTSCTGAFAGCTTLTAINMASNNPGLRSANGVLFTKDLSMLYEMPSGIGGTYIIPATVTSVHDYAFYACKITSVTLPLHLNSIGEFSFAYCGGLDHIDFPASLQEIGEYAFQNCASIPALTIPKSVASIGYYAFESDRSLSSVTFESGSTLSRLSNSTFANTALSEIIIPASVQTMGQNVFSGCDKLTKAEFAGESLLEYIPADLFFGADNLTTVVFGNNNKIKRIEARAFENLTSLSSINLEKCIYLESLDNYCFINCRSLSKIEIPSTVTYIGRYAFNNCKALSSIKLPAGLDYIGRYAFSGTNNMVVYLLGPSIPPNAQPNWNAGIKGYYTGTAKIISSGDWRYVVQSDNSVSITGYTGKASNLIIETIDGRAVSSIGCGAFKGNTALTGITLPDTLTAIYSNAFYGTTSLARIGIPDKVAFIGDYAFYNSAISQATLTSASELTKIGKYAFANTRKLASVSIATGVTAISDHAFYKSGVQTVKFTSGSKLIDIGNSAFEGTAIATISLPSGLASIGSRAFANTPLLKSVGFGTVTGLTVSSYAFSGSGLSGVSIPANVTYIGEFCFSGCKNLLSFTVNGSNPGYSSSGGVLYSKGGTKLIAYPAGKTGACVIGAQVRSIGFGAFENSNVTGVSFASGCKINSIGYRAFYGCSKLTTISIPNSLLSIDFYAFANCGKLTSVGISNGSQLSGIYEGAFYNDKSLASIKLPIGVQEVGDYAFYGCSALADAGIQSCSLRFVGDHSFDHSGLTALTIPASLETIGEYAFANLSHNQSVNIVIPNTVEQIGYGALSQLPKIQTLTVPFLGDCINDSILNRNIGWIFGTEMEINATTAIPQTLTKIVVTNKGNIYSGQFYGCDKLVTVELPEGVTMLDEYCFRNCSSLKNVVLPDSIAHIGGSAFSGCPLSSTFVLPRNVTEIDSWAFYGTSIQSIRIPATVTSLASDAFSSCGQLTNLSVDATNPAYKSVDNVLLTKDGTMLLYCLSTKTGNYTVPQGVKTIVTDAFYGSSLSLVTLPASLTTIKQAAFRYCNIGGNINIPAGVNSIEINNFIEMTNITGFTVSAGNPAYKAVGGVLYNRQMTKVIAVPCAYAGDLIFPDTVTDMGNFQFRSLRNITGLILPEGLTSFSEVIRCPKLEYIDIPDSVTNLFTIGDNEKLRCVICGYKDADLGSLTLDNLFCGNGEVKTTVYIRANHLPAKTYSVYADYVLNAVELLKRSDCILVKMSDGTASLVKYSGSAQNLNLSTLYAGGISYIQSGAFNECTALKSITIPATVNKISGTAFQGCASLERVDFNHDPNFITTNGITYNKSGTEIVYVDPVFNGTAKLPSTLKHIPAHAFERTAYYKNSSNWANGCLYLGGCLIEANNPKGSGFIKPGTWLIADYAVKSFGGTELVVPDSIKYLGLGCLALGAAPYYQAPEYQLHKLTLPFAGSSATNPEFDYLYFLFGRSRVEGQNVYTKLTDVVITGGNSIPDGFFADREYLQSITLKGNTITSIGKNAFGGCAKLRSLVIPDSVQSIGVNAFSQDSMLEQLILPKGASIKTIPYSESLKNVVVSCGSGDLDTMLEKYRGTLPTKPNILLYNQRGEFNPNDLPNFHVSFYFADEWHLARFYVGDKLIQQNPVPVNSVIHAPASNSITKPSDGVHSYTFIGWDINKDGKVDSLPATLSQNLTATAVFSTNAIQYTVTFNSQGGSSVTSKTAANNTAITAPTVPLRTGYTFGGWYKEAACTNVWNFATDKITSNITLWAKWTISNYTVSFNSQGGSAVAAMTAKYGATISAPVPPTRTGCTFGGWYTAASNGTKIAFPYQVKNNVTLYAHWSVRAPGNLCAISVTDNSIKLTWTAATGTAGYTVVRSLSASFESPVTMPVPAGANTFTDTGLKTGTTYYYKVCAYVGSSKKQYSAYTAAIGTTVSSTNASAKLTWAAVPGTTSYEVSRATSAAGAYTVVGKPTASTWTNTGLKTGTTYYYRVRAYNGTSKTFGPYRAIGSIELVPATPSSVSAVRVSASCIKVAWAAVSGANGYEISRAASADGSYSVLGTVSTTSYTNSSLKIGTTYYYRIRSYILIGTAKVYSNDSRVVYAKP